MKFPPIRVLLSGKSSYRGTDSGEKVSGEMQSNLKRAVAQTHFTQCSCDKTFKEKSWNEVDLQLARLCVVRVSSDRLQLLFILSHMDSSRDFGRNSVVPTVCLLLEQMNAHATIVGAIVIVFSNA